MIWNLAKKITLLDVETDSTVPIIGMQFMNPFCPALVTCSLEGKFRVWALHTPLVAPQRAKHDESINFSKQEEFETAVVGELFVPDEAIGILYGANQISIDQNKAGARTLLVQIPESKRCVCILTPHGHRLHCISQLSSNGYFATCGAGSEVLLWKASSIACMKSFTMLVKQLLFSRNNLTLNQAGNSVFEPTSLFIIRKIYIRVHSRWQSFAGKGRLRPQSYQRGCNFGDLPTQ